jgi:hypothetical protein
MSITGSAAIDRMAGGGDLRQTPMAGRTLRSRGCSASSRPGCREDSVFRKRPAALVFVARNHATACLEGCRDGYRVVRTELSDRLPPHTVDAVLDAYRNLGGRLSSRGADTALWP